VVPRRRVRIVSVIFVQVDPREALIVAIAALATSWKHFEAQAQSVSAAATLWPTGKLRAHIASNPVL